MAIVEFQDSTGRFDRRIGRREDIEPVHAVWVDRERPSGRRRDPRRVSGRPAEVVNVSVTGAAVTAPGDLWMIPGSLAVIRCEGVDVPVTVCRRQRTDGRGIPVYGVEFLSV
jgi:hypothetical protein